MNLLILLLPLIVGLTWLRLIRPGFTETPGASRLTVSLPLLARIRMHLVPAVAALIAGCLLAVNGIMPWWAMVFPVVSNVLLVAIPVSYTLTDTGIRLGWTSFRRWTEFAGVQRAPGGARLIGAHKSRGMQIWLSGSRGDDEFLQFLRQTLKNAYKGTSGVTQFPTERVITNQPPDTDAYQNGISAYTAEH